MGGGSWGFRARWMWTAQAVPLGTYDFMGDTLRRRKSNAGFGGVRGDGGTKLNWWGPRSGGERQDRKKKGKKEAKKIPKYLPPSSGLGGTRRLRR